ncbi:MAG: oligosaccharide flippase family protein [Cyanobacteria bacterium J06598_3]
MFTANLAARASGIIALALLSRFLSVEELGVYSLIFWVVLSGTAIAKLGCDISLHRNGARLYKSDPEAVSRLLGVGITLMLLSFALAGSIIYVFRVPLSDFWLGNSDVSSWLQYGALALLFEGLGVTFTTCLLAFHQFKARSLAITLGAFARLLLVPALAFFYGVSGALIGFCMASFVQAVVAIYGFRQAIANRNISLSLTHFWREAKDIFAFGLPYYVGDASIGLFYLPVMGELRQAAGLEALGYLRIAQSMSQLIGFLPAAIAPVVISLLSEAHGSDDKDFEKLRSIHLRSNWLLALVMVTFVSAAAPSIITVMFGAKYLPAVPLLIGMCWGTLVSVVARNLNVYSISAGNTKLVSMGAISEKVTFISSAMWSIQRFQGMGFVMSRLVALVLQCIVMLFGLWHSFNAKLKQDIYALLGVSLAAAVISNAFSVWGLSILMNGIGGGAIALVTVVVATVLVFSRCEMHSLHGYVLRQSLRFRS